MTRSEFIHKYQHLFWYFDKKKLDEMSDTVLVEFIFNYGDWDAVKELCEVIGFKKMKEIYVNLPEGQINNYFPEMYSLLGNLIKRHA